MTAGNPRAECLKALSRWEKERCFADEILHEALEQRSMSPLDRAFFTETFYGVLRNLSRLDFWISKLRDKSLDDETRNVVRLGLYQLFLMRVPDHAAVNETVELAGPARGLVNAVLRRAVAERDALATAAESAPAHVRWSHPEFLVARWTKNFGCDAVGRICRWNNQPAPVYVRVNNLKVTRGELLCSLPEATPHQSHPLAIAVERLPYSWIVGGYCYVQDPSTLLACDLLDPQPGERVLDACAAPGGKTSYLAQLMKNSGQLVACDSEKRRIKRLDENLRRLSVCNAELILHDWLTHACKWEPESFDRILLDAPCSNTGVMRRRVDVRWRLRPEDFQRMQRVQIAMIRALVPLLKPGGALVYSTCSLEPEENEDVADRVRSDFGSLRQVEIRKVQPFKDQVDGAFAVRFEQM